ncbi:hypothetical protein OG613_48735 (plasmid) [Streptomyces sp. NBC_00015]|uniref:hypothetical protein n=1 Tax=Streptomyces sp. NBC_00015 TaxID=2903611 RepID=UPI002F907903
MPPAAKGPKAVLQFMRGRLIRLARRSAHVEEDSSPNPTQPPRTDDNPFAPLFDVLESFDADLKDLRAKHLRFHSRLIHLEDAESSDPEQSHRPDRDPMGPVFDALEAVAGELCGFAARLTQLEDTGSYGRPGMRTLVICPRTCRAAVHAVQSRPPGEAVQDA